jgi:hypothetical protein
MPQGIGGVNLFNTFEEEHNTPTIPRYNTRTLARHHAAHLAQTRRPRVFRPLAFSPRQTMPKQMANSVINEYTGASLEYRHLINDASTFTIWNEATANEFGRLADWRKALVTALTAQTKNSLSHAKPSQKENLLPSDSSLSTSVPTNLKSSL